VRERERSDHIMITVFAIEIIDGDVLQCDVTLYTVLNCTTMYRTVVYYTTLYCTALNCIAMCFTALYNAIRHYTKLYCTVCYLSGSVSGDLSQSGHSSSHSEIEVNINIRNTYTRKMTVQQCTVLSNRSTVRKSRVRACSPPEVGV
jgi:hypothetical protein